MSLLAPNLLINARKEYNQTRAAETPVLTWEAEISTTSSSIARGTSLLDNLGVSGEPDGDIPLSVLGGHEADIEAHTSSNASLSVRTAVYYRLPVQLNCLLQDAHSVLSALF